MVYQPDIRQEPLVVDDPVGGAGGSGNNIDLHGSADHGCHRQQAGKQTQGKRM